MLVGGDVFIAKALEKIKQNQPPLLSRGLTGFQVGARAADSSDVQVPRSLPCGVHHLAAGPWAALQALPPFLLQNRSWITLFLVQPRRLYRALLCIAAACFCSST